MEIESWTCTQALILHTCSFLETDPCHGEINLQSLKGGTDMQWDTIKAYCESYVWSSAVVPAALPQSVQLLISSLTHMAMKGEGAG